MAPITRAQSVRMSTVDITRGSARPRRTGTTSTSTTDNNADSSPTNGSSSLLTSHSSLVPETPPIYTIDLSCPPAERYVQVAKAYRKVLNELTPIFDEVMLQHTRIPPKTMHFVARLLLRKLKSSEETQELQGISKAAGVDMYLLIAMNVILDSLMGCTSGGMLVKGRNNRTSRRMVHFRTLDWTMDPLRKALVQYEFVEKPGGKVIAKTISYVGFVGALTGVRQGLSVSLNVRPYHNNDRSWWHNARFYLHVGLVLLGWRPSICSHLRQCIVPKTKKHGKNWKLVSNLPGLIWILRDFPAIPTTAAYVIACDGSETAVLEKDRVTATIFRDTSFITATNHDRSYESTAASRQAHVAHAKTHLFGTEMKDIIEDSTHRKACMTNSWNKQCEKRTRRGQEPYARLDQVVDWLSEFPVTNELTHFATVLDPTTGEVAWIKRYEAGAVVDSSSDSSWSV